MSKLLIVIPAYNEEESIVSVVEELTTHYPQYDYVVVNDGSRDKTAAVCRAHGYRLIDLPVNLGLAGAFQTGLRYAAENDYDCAMQLDADGQHKPEFIAPMLEALEEGNDIVIGSRFLTVKKPKTLRMLDTECTYVYCEGDVLRLSEVQKGIVRVLLSAQTGAGRRCAMPY